MVVSWTMPEVTEKQGYPIAAVRVEGHARDVGSAQWDNRGYQTVAVPAREFTWQTGEDGREYMFKVKFCTARFDDPSRSPWCNSHGASEWVNSNQITATWVTAAAPTATPTASPVAPAPTSLYVMNEHFSGHDFGASGWVDKCASASRAARTVPRLSGGVLNVSVGHDDPAMVALLCHDLPNVEPGGRYSAVVTVGAMGGGALDLPPSFWATGDQL